MSNRPQRVQKRVGRKTCAERIESEVGASCRTAAAYSGETKGCSEDGRLEIVGVWSSGAESEGAAGARRASRVETFGWSFVGRRSFDAQDSSYVAAESSASSSAVDLEFVVSPWS